MNEQNLRHFTSEQSHEEAVNNGKKGGIASGEARRRKKLVAEALSELLQKTETTSDGNEIIRLDAITQKALANCFNGHPTLDDIYLIQKILGEAKINVEENIKMPNFGVLEQ